MQKSINQNLITHKLPNQQNLKSYDFKRAASLAFESWKKAFSFTQEDLPSKTNGLRTPQIGALHATLAHWSVSKTPATIVMPTGTGKTETMISLLVKCQIPKLLIVVPSDSLREQIVGKFQTFGLLQDADFNVIGPEAVRPVVGLYKKGFKSVENLNEFLSSCNVVVATLSVLHYCNADMGREIARQCSHLFIDEAHHSEAPSWKKVRNWFAEKPVLQFTATPYRNDGKRVDGKIIYDFPLRQAQEEGYFKPIRLESVREYQLEKADAVIAERAIEILREARKKYNQILMARVDNISHAKTVFEIYQEKCPELKPVLVHSQLPENELALVRKAIIGKEHFVIVCVNMLGEGFDLPELKIVALHDIKKSLPATLQLFGRFTRTKYDEELGEAVAIANLGNVDAKSELDELYTRDSDWNILLPQISQAQTQKEKDFYELISGFKDMQDADIPLQGLYPALSTVIYKNKGDSWSPNRYKKGFQGADNYYYLKDFQHEHEHLRVIVSGQEEPVPWGRVNNVKNITWELYVIFWDTKNNLLFINSSNTKGTHKLLANAVLDDNAELVEGQVVFRVFANIHRLFLQNLGLSRPLGQNISHVGYFGRDTLPGISALQKGQGLKSVIFGAGRESGEKTTIGASKGGRIWSFQRGDLLAFVKWCKHISKKIMDDSIDPDKFIQECMKPKIAKKRPAAFPILVDWHEDYYLEFLGDWELYSPSGKYLLDDLSITLVNPSEDGAMAFGLENEDGDILATFELVLTGEGFSIRKTIPSENISIGKNSQKLQSAEDFFTTYPPTFFFANGSTIVGGYWLIEKEEIPLPFLKDKIEAWDWTGINLKRESQKAGAVVKDSIQFRTIEELQKLDYNFIFNDDGSGEIADIIAIRETDETIFLDLFHLKYAVEGRVSTLLDNLYVVCGQTQRSASWKSVKTEKVFKHMFRRDQQWRDRTGFSRLINGTLPDLERLSRIAAREKSLQFNAILVQPGLSKSGASDGQLQLLGVTENYLFEQAAMAFRVIGSH